MNGRSWTRQRTFTREQVAESRAAWESGRFSSEWNPWKRLAAVEAGIIYPPNGDAYDSWTDAQPSQRAILIRAIRETPDLLRRCITAPGAKSWGDVVDRLLRGLGDMAADVEMREYDWLRAKRGDAPTRVGDVLGTLGDSLGIDR